MNNVISKALALGAVASLATSLQAANHVVKITGSTAFRNLAFTAIKNSFSSAPTITPSSATASSSTVTFFGTHPAFPAGDTLEVRCAYSGSIEGIVNMLRISNPPGAVAQPTYLTTAGAVDSNTTADLAFSDAYQKTTQFAPKNAANTLSEYPSGGCGIVTFTWVRNTAAGASLDNITAQTINQLMGSGSLPLNYFLGADLATASSAIYLAGRYPYSGTRLIAGADSYYGANKAEVLFKDVGGVATSDTGFAKGGDLRDNIKNSSIPFVTYLGLGDQNGTVTNIKYNGVPFSRLGVINGVYSFWSTEHLYGPAGGTTADAALFVNGNSNSDPFLSNGLISTLDTVLLGDLSYLSISEPNVARNGDGFPIYSLF
jgi:hypothetical protein